MPELLNFGLDKLLFNDLIQGTLRLNALSKSVSDWRVAQGSSLPRKDLFAALMEAKDPETGRGLTHGELVSEAGLLIIGGSDTTISSTTATIFYLLHYPDKLRKLQDEVRNTFSAVEEICIGPQLASCSYLTACIDESMRLSPAIGSLLPREVLPGGLVVDGEWFPPGTNMGVPHYTLHHNEDYFPDPYLFVPERWIPDQSPFSVRDEEAVDISEKRSGETQNPSPTSKSDTNHTKAQLAFTPFGFGRTSCVGKYLAYQEMSLVIARLMWLYDMRLEPGSTAGEGNAKFGPGRTRKNEFQLQDRFVATHEGPMVQFRPRQ